MRIWIPVALEIAIVATFIVHRSIPGLLLCAAYAWFSATWAFVISTFRNDDHFDD